ncbi:hypothetical protein [Actinoplanes sp. NPDC051859]|uniref:Rv0361 family membrane protein n=1 Tax=Actinoplanes sp. NPDC051859 TaxID=3363909 RepID=UPI00379D5172
MTAPVDPAPPPPPGPGVIPPFPAPPVEGRGRRVGLGIGLGVGALVLVLVGGFAAIIGFGSVATRAFNEQIDVVVSDYYDALRDKAYADAYEMQCQEARDRQTQDEFTRETTARGAVAGFDVGDADMLELAAPVDVRYTDGSSDRHRVYLEQNRRTGGFEVCRIEG